METLLLEKTPAQIAKKNVNRGFKRIKAYYDGSTDWMHRIDFSNLYVSSAMYCVLAQVFGNYNEGLILLGFDNFGSMEIPAHGFCTNIMQGLDDNVLREAWRDRITQALAA